MPVQQHEGLLVYNLPGHARDQGSREHPQQSVERVVIQKWLACTAW